MQDLLAALPDGAPEAFNVLAVVAVLLPPVVSVVRRVRTGRWRLAAGTRAWRAAVVLLVACPTAVGVCLALADLTADARRLASHDRAWFEEREVTPDEAVIRALQDRYGVILDGYLLPWSVDDPQLVEVVEPGPTDPARTCMLVIDPERVDQLMGGDADRLDTADVTFDEQVSAHQVRCEGTELEPQDGPLGVPVATELVERTWPGQRAPRALAAGVLAGGGIGLLLVFMAYSLGIVRQSGDGAARGDALLADLRERVRTDPAERAAVIDRVVAVVHEDDELRARQFATMPLDDLLQALPDDVDLTGQELLAEYLADAGTVRLPATNDPEQFDREQAAIRLAVERQRDLMSKDPDEVERVRRFALGLIDRLNDEIRATREAGLAGTFVPSEVDRDAVVLSDDLLREHLVATGAITATEMAAPGLRTWLRGFAWSALFAPVIGLLAWLMTATEEGEVQWRWEAVATAETVDAFVAHYGALGVDVELPGDREALEADRFFNAVDGTRGSDTCFGWYIGGRALLSCGTPDDRDWT